MNWYLILFEITAIELRKKLVIDITAFVSRGIVFKGIFFQYCTAIESRSRLL